jgi:uncharacterized protein with von Willebrand factor type A (vWA) domain
VSAFLGNLLGFGRILRRAGLDVHPGRLLDLVDALGHVDLGSRDEVYHTCRTLLVHSRDDIAVFDRAFAAFWDVQREAAAAPKKASARQSLSILQAEEVMAPGAPIDSPESDPRGEEQASTEIALRTWSDRTVDADKDFAAFTAADMAAARDMLVRLQWTPGERRTRRWIAGRGPRIDLRRAIADSLETGGDIVRLARRRRKTRPRPLVLLCDVSGSMERYARMLLHFAHAATRRHTRVETFVFSTELTRISRELARPGADAAVAAAARAMRGWSGGTRIGHAIRQLHQRWGRRVLHGAPVVLLISDGWDRGDPQELGDEVARLQRASHRLIWLNPLIGTADYAPLTRGLQAALPFVDDFLPARTLKNLADLALHLNGLAS